MKSTVTHLPVPPDPKSSRRHPIGEDREMTSTPSRKRRATLAALAATGIALAGSLSGLGPQSAVASSHREAPLIAGDPAADNTDLYAFVSPERPGYVTFIANWIPFEEPNGGPELLPVRHRRRVQHQRRQRRRRQGRRRRSGGRSRTSTSAAATTFLYNNGPVTSLDDENLLFRQTYTLESSFNGGPFKTRVTNAPGGAVADRQRLDARLPGAARPGHASSCRAAGSCSPARPTTRSSSTCGSSTCSTAAT